MISLIVAMDKNNGIGYKNDLPWYLPNDLQHFKKTTTDKVVVMGRKTFESIGKPLPGRKNVVLTRDKNYKADKVSIIHSLDDIFKLNDENRFGELFVIGGAELFNEMLPFASRMYVTKIDHIFKSDTFFPEFNRDEWIITQMNKGKKDDRNNYDYYFFQYDRSL